MRQWRLIVHDPMPGAANMAADEAILRTVASGNQPPTLRLYAWTPLCLSLGYGQRAADADLGQLERKGWGLVRRPTGGRAILHGDELTYSVALPEAHPLAKGGIIETYLRLSRALLGAMQTLGLPVLADPDGDTDSTKGPVCFEVPSRYEITVGGKKLIGSAQMRRHNGMLQHGTIPICGDITRICDALAYPDTDTREAARAKVRQRAATLESAGLAGITWGDVAQALVDNFVKALSIELVHGDLSEHERSLADQLYNDTYTHPDWTFKR